MRWVRKEEKRERWGRGAAGEQRERGKKTLVGRVLKMRFLDVQSAKGKRINAKTEVTGKEGEMDESRML